MGLQQIVPYLIMGDGTAQFPFEAYLADMNDDGTSGDLSATADRILVLVHHQH